MEESRHRLSHPEALKKFRQTLHGKVDAAIERMLEKSPSGVDPYSLDFTGRESLAFEIGQEISVLLLHENLVQDSWREIVEESQSWKCPRCGTDSPRKKNKKGEERYDSVELRTRSGKVPLRVRLFYCSKCRKSFSPLPTACEPGAGEP